MNEEAGTVRNRPHRCCTKDADWIAAPVHSGRRPVEGSRCRNGAMRRCGDATVAALIRSGATLNSGIVS